MGTLLLPKLFSKGGRPRKKIDPKRIVRLRAKGLSWRAIGRELGVHARTVKRYAQGRIATDLPHQPESGKEDVSRDRAYLEHMERRSGCYED